MTRRRLARRPLLVLVLAGGGSGAAPGAPAAPAGAAGGPPTSGQADRQRRVVHDDLLVVLVAGLLERSFTDVTPVRSIGSVTGVAPIGRLPSPRKMSAPSGADFTKTWNLRAGSLDRGRADVGRRALPPRYFHPPKPAPPRARAAPPPPTETSTWACSDAGAVPTASNGIGCAPDTVREIGGTVRERDCRGRRRRPARQRSLAAGARRGRAALGREQIVEHLLQVRRLEARRVHDVVQRVGHVGGVGPAPRRIALQRLEHDVRPARAGWPGSAPTAAAPRSGARARWSGRRSGP